MFEREQKSLSAVFSSPLALCKCIYATLCCVYFPLSLLTGVDMGEFQIAVSFVFIAMPLSLLPVIMIVTGGWITYFAKNQGKIFAFGLALDIFGRIIGCVLMVEPLAFAVMLAVNDIFFISVALLGVSVVVCNIAVCVLEYKLRAISTGWEEINYSAGWLTGVCVCAVISAVVYFGISFLFKGDGSPLWCFAACITALQFCGIEPFTPILLGRYRNEEKK